MVTGGRRSGKSGYAQRLAEKNPGGLVYIATAEARDDEMSERIKRHQSERETKRWTTIEKPLFIPTDMLFPVGSSVALFDCVTIWVSNMMESLASTDPQKTEISIVQTMKRILATFREIDGSIIFVTNEVGLGVTPDNELARVFSDIAGRVNQTIAKEADEVVLLVSGLPVKLK